MLCRSNNISHAVSPPKSATSAILRRRWGTPQCCASSTRHATLHRPPISSWYPPQVFQPFSGTSISGASGSAMRMASSRTAAKSFPPLELKAPGTFSQTIYRGRTNSPVRPLAMSCAFISLIIRICSMYRPERAPASPARFPAMERSWLSRIRNNQDYAEKIVIPK